MNEGDGSARKAADRQAVDILAAVLAAVVSAFAVLNAFLLLLLPPKWAALFEEIGVELSLLPRVFLGLAATGWPYALLVLLFSTGVIVAAWLIARSRRRRKWVPLAIMAAGEPAFLVILVLVFFMPVVQLVNSVSGA